MKTYWASLTRREQTLMAVAGGLLALFAVYIGAVMPLIRYQSDAKIALTQASRVYEAVARSAQTVEQSQHRDTPEANQQPVRLALTSVAREKGVTLNRIQPETDQTLTLWIESVSVAALYSWLLQLENEHGIAPLKVTIQKTGAPGLLRVQLQFYEGIGA